MVDECWIEEGLEKTGRSLIEAVSGQLPGGTLKNHENPVRIACVLVESWTEHPLPRYKSLERHCKTNLTKGN
jgi:hypothetical protein